MLRHSVSASAEPTSFLKNETSSAELFASVRPIEHQNTCQLSSGVLRLQLSQC